MINYSIGMKLRKYIWSFVTALLIISCSKKEDISGKVEGIWQTEWDDMLDGDLDNMTVKEIIALNDDGTFEQIFSGSIDFDDWDNETQVAYAVLIEGKWHVGKPDKIVLQYDMNQFEVEIGKSAIEADYSDAAIGLLTGNWGGALSGFLKGSNTDKLNQKVEAEVEKQVKKYFRDMFVNINKDKKAFSNVEISSGTLSAKINHGFMGRDCVYYSSSNKSPESSVANNRSVKESTAKKTSSSSHKQMESSSASTGNSNDDWIVGFNGSIGKYPIKMYLNLKNINNYDWCEVEGKYCYTSSGSGSYLYLSGVRQGESLELSEYNDKGEVSGTFNGKLEIYGNLAWFEYSGTFTNYAGKTFNFSLKSN